MQESQQKADVKLLRGMCQDPRWRTHASGWWDGETKGGESTNKSEMSQKETKGPLGGLPVLEQKETGLLTTLQGVVNG